MSADTATAGKLLIAFVAGALVTAIGAASLWPKAMPTSGGPIEPPSQAAVKQPEPTQSTASRPSANTDTAFCKVVSNYARMVMESRQKGVPMADMMEISEKASPEVNPMLKKMIVAAFEEPRMAVETNQERRIRDFENEAFLGCIKG